MDFECTAVLDDRPLRQGDVFVWLDAHVARPWKSYGMVVTADCDLAKEKIHGRVSYIPLLTMEDYLWWFWMPGKFQSLYSDYAKKVTQRINRYLQKSNPSHQGVSTSAAVEWVKRVGAHQLPNELGITDLGQRKDLSSFVQRFVDIGNLLDGASPNIGLLKECYKYKNTKAELGDDRMLAEDFQKSVASLPGDVFFLSNLPGAEDHGLFLMLRYITQCEINDIAITQEKVRFEGAAAKRIAKVSAPYLYAITQNLTRVFSDIGLPSHYEGRLNSSASRFFGVDAGRAE